MKDVFLISDVGVYVSSRLDEAIRRAVDKRGGSPNRRGWSTYPKVKRAEVEKKAEDLYSGESIPRHFWEKHRKNLISWAVSRYVR